jgi:hypothetical protein
VYWPFFHGGNTGSNPVGDANKISQLDDIAISIKICGNATVTVDLRKAPPVSGRLPDGCRPDRVARRACLPDLLTPQPDRSSVWGPPDQRVGVSPTVPLAAARLSQIFSFLIFSSTLHFCRKLLDVLWERGDASQAVEHTVMREAVDIRRFFTESSGVRQADGRL